MCFWSYDFVKYNKVLFVDLMTFCLLIGKLEVSHLSCTYPGLCSSKQQLKGEELLLDQQSAQNESGELPPKKTFTSTLLYSLGGVWLIYLCL